MQVPYVSSHPRSEAPSRAPSRGSPPPTSRPASPAPRRRELEHLSDADAFRLATRPAAHGEDWGIPPPAGPPSSALSAKVAQFLQLKRGGQHINTSLLQSSSFANPHIYAKLVEFVELDETATAFPAAGWLTRRHIADEIPLHGPQALLAQQNAMADAVRARQDRGKGGRREIAFAPARTADRRVEREALARGRERDGSGRDYARDHRDRDRDRDRRGRERDRDERDRGHRSKNGRD
ncbi:hypothetical protein Q8F55_002955 [Vanrija albida]|uniref:HCNGP-like protein n=1 Tax=Vanrija albida TaxID=181172 RepID=A0ABR3QBS0_9TREE